MKMFHYRILPVLVLLLAGCTAPSTKAVTPLIDSPTVLASVRPVFTLTNTSTPSPAASTTPSPTSLPPVAEDIVSGDNHSCRLHSNGSVTCWGWNAFGQAGQPISGQSIAENTVPGLRGIIALSAGAYHTCALDWQGKVFCWGRNNDGQLGDGTATGSSTPVLVTGLEAHPIRQISAGSMHTCAIDQSGGLWCWGSNRDGKLSAATEMFYTSIPLRVEGIGASVTLVAAGSTHTCAMNSEREIWCWGDGTFGQIGLNPFGIRASPVLAATLTDDAVSLTAGWFHTCLLDADHGVRCWGKNQEGQLGNEAFISRADPVYPIKMNSNVSLISSGGQETCVVREDGKVFCWGENNYGQIGDSTRIDRIIPSEISVPETPVRIAVGGSHVCALARSGGIYCWGANDLGQLGTYEINPIPTPTPTVFASTRPS